MKERKVGRTGGGGRKGDRGGRTSGRGRREVIYCTKRKYEELGTMTCVGNGVELLIQEGERDDDGVGEDDGDEQD
jgi:hypothetical protein